MAILVAQQGQDFGHITAGRRSQGVTHGFLAGNLLEELKLRELYTHPTPHWGDNVSKMDVIRFPHVSVWHGCI